MYFEYNPDSFFFLIQRKISKIFKVCSTTQVIFVVMHVTIFLIAKHTRRLLRRLSKIWKSFGQHKCPSKTFGSFVPTRQCLQENGKSVGEWKRNNCFTPGTGVICLRVLGFSIGVFFTLRLFLTFVPRFPRAWDFDLSFGEVTISCICVSELGFEDVLSFVWRGVSALSESGGGESGVGLVGLYSTGIGAKSSSSIWDTVYINKKSVTVRNAIKVMTVWDFRTITLCQVLPRSDTTRFRTKAQRSVKKEESVTSSSQAVLLEYSELTFSHNLLDVDDGVSGFCRRRGSAGRFGGGDGGGGDGRCQRRWSGLWANENASGCCRRLIRWKWFIVENRLQEFEMKMKVASLLTYKYHWTLVYWVKWKCVVFLEKRVRQELHSPVFIGKTTHIYLLIIIYGCYYTCNK